MQPQVSSCVKDQLTKLKPLFDILVVSTLEVDTCNAAWGNASKFYAKQLFNTIFKIFKEFIIYLLIKGHLIAHDTLYFTLKEKMVLTLSIEVLQVVI